MSDIYSDMQKRSEIALKDPKPGDYWQEMLCPVLVVLGVTPDQVCVLDKRRITGDTWTWDIDAKPKVMSRRRFEERLSYDSMDGTWADVAQTRHDWVVGYFAGKWAEAA